MVNALLTGQYRITSLVNNEPLSLSNVPSPLAVIVLPQGILPYNFTVVPVGDGDDTYVILVDNRNTRGENERVFAYEDRSAEVWVIRYREPQDAYTIERRDGPLPSEPPPIPIPSLAWTVPDRESETERQDQVLLRPLIVLLSDPPQYIPSQLFRFERVLSQE
ncbi:hypothetical protein EDC04DRAFT_2915383 [Pisolithus marmoratus]|nr:hypothetical protein EDC04DRAFT_2915383 [Pisolithus marmoratus]